MAVLAPRLTRRQSPSGQVTVRLGGPLLDAYLEFLEGRCRPNTVLAAGFDLKVFFTVVAKPPAQVTSADVLASSPRSGPGAAAATAVAAVADTAAGAVSARTVRRRLSSVSGLFAYLQARGDVAANPVPRGLPTRRERATRPAGVAAGALAPHPADDPVA